MRGVEKRTPHHLLEGIKAAIAARGIDCFTRSAQDDVVSMGLTAAQAIAVLLALERVHFFKSMTTYADPRAWQDVYHVPTPCGTAYVKFTLRKDGSVVISFKEHRP